MSDIDLRTIDGFNNLNKKSKYKIMTNFNLFRYKFMLDEMKDIYNNISDINTKEILEKKMNKIFQEGCTNFYIINSIYDFNIYINGKYYLYFNTKSKKYYLSIIKKNILNNKFNIDNQKDSDKNINNNDNDNNDVIDNLEYRGYYTLGNDLIWKKVIN